MKKNILILFFVCVFFVSYTEISMNEFLDKMMPLIEKNPQYIKNELSLKLNGRKAFSEFKEWFPFPYMDIDIIGSGVEVDKMYNSFQSSTSFGLKQKLPLGISLGLFGKQAYEIFFGNNEEHSYKFSSGARLGIPLWFIAPDILRDFADQDFSFYKEQKKQLELERKIAKKDLIIKTISVIGTEKILKKKMDVLNNFQKLHFEDIEKDKVLFSQGRLSLLELAEKEKKAQQEEFKFYQTEADYKNILFEMEAMGLDFNDLSEDIDLWFDFFENFALYLQLSAPIKKDIRLLRHKNNWLNTVKTFQGMLPNIVFSCDVDAVPNQSYYPSFYEAFNGYWKGGSKLRWSISMNLRINLSPFHDDFRLNKNFKLAKEINSLESLFLKQKIEDECYADLKRIDISKEVLKKTKTVLELQKKYLVLGDELYRQGKISLHELKLSENALEDLKLDYYSERLSFIIMVLKTYNF